MAVQRFFLKYGALRFFYIFGWVILVGRVKQILDITNISKHFQIELIMLYVSKIFIKAML